MNNTELRAALCFARGPIEHVIMDRPLRCSEQMATAFRIAEKYGAQTHLTPGCYGEPTRQRPGCGSDCMPLTETGYDRCRHDLDELRAEGAFEIGSFAACWLRAGEKICPTCHGEWQGQMAFPDEYPVSQVSNVTQLR